MLSVLKLTCLNQTFNLKASFLDSSRLLFIQSFSLLWLLLLSFFLLLQLGATKIVLLQRIGH